MQRITVKIPKMGLTTEEVTLDEWLVATGDHVNEGDVLANLQADKATIELEAPSSGRVIQILVPADEDEALAIGSPVIVIECAIKG